MNHYISVLSKFCAANKAIIIILIFVIGISIYQYDNISRQIESNPSPVHSTYCVDRFAEHQNIIDEFYEKRKNWRTSNLGSVMFKNIAPEVFIHDSREKRHYTVLIWKYYEWLKKRHLQAFDNTANINNDDPLSECSVSNCKVVGDDAYLDTADAVVVHVQKGVFPSVEVRNTSQRWILLSDESPMNTFSLAKNTITLQSLENVFNWTMTYRSDSDIPVPYGRTLPLSAPILPAQLENPDNGVAGLIPNWNRKRMDSVALLMSHCAVKQRTDFLNELQKYIIVDVHGACATNPVFKKSCPGHFRADCEVLSQYLFYLVLENSKCRQYLTEKVFYNAYAKGAIPVIMGPPLEDCEKLLPPNSYIHVDNYKSIKDMAKYIKTITSDTKVLLSYHRWRNNFYVVSEHGYFGLKSYHYCRICEALNYNDGEISIYSEDRLRLYLDQSLLCT